MTARHTAIAATLLLALTTVPGAAQTTLHLSGGLNRAKVTYGPDWVMRAVAGAALSFPVSERVNLQLGVDYAQKGLGSNFGRAEILSANLDYMEASALLELAVAGGERASLHLLVGPTFGLNISCEFRSPFLGLPDGHVVDCDHPNLSGDIPAGSDGGVAGGFRAGVGITDSMDVTIGAFYNFGTRNIAQSTRGSATGKSRTMTARAGFAYRIG